MWLIPILVMTQRRGFARLDSDLQHDGSGLIEMELQQPV